MRRPVKPRRILQGRQAATTVIRRAMPTPEPAGLPRITRRPAWGRPGDGMVTFEGGKPSILLICTRVGEADYVPPGYLLANCDLCQQSCWLNPDVSAMAERRGMTIVANCFGCLGSGEDAHACPPMP